MAYIVLPTLAAEPVLVSRTSAPAWAAGRPARARERAADRREAMRGRRAMQCWQDRLIPADLVDVWGSPRVAAPAVGVHARRASQCRASTTPGRSSTATAAATARDKACGSLSIVLWVSRLLHSLCAFEAQLLLIADGDGGSDDPRQSVRVSIHRPLGPLPLARRSRPRS